jgi:hypothetical protein
VRKFPACATRLGHDILRIAPDGVEHRVDPAYQCSPKGLSSTLKDQADRG